MAYTPKDMWELDEAERLGLELTPEQKQMRASIDTQIDMANNPDAFIDKLVDESSAIYQAPEVAKSLGGPKAAEFTPDDIVNDEVGSQKANVQSETPRKVINRYPYDGKFTAPTTDSDFIVTEDKTRKINPMHELFKRDLMKQIGESSMSEEQKEAALKVLGGMGSSDVFSRYQEATTGRNDPRVNSMRDTTDLKLKQGLINSWNINRAYNHLAPVGEQPDFDGKERDKFRDWVLDKERMDIADKRADRIGGAKAPANVQLNSLIMQERGLENDLSRFVANKPTFINKFIQSNKDMPNVAAAAEQAYQSTFTNMQAQLADIRSRKEAAGGTDYAASVGSQPVKTVDGTDVAAQSDEARAAEKAKKEADAKYKREFKEMERRDKLAEQTNEKVMQLYNGYKTDPRVKMNQESKSQLAVINEQWDIYNDKDSTPEQKAVAQDTMLKATERLQNSGTVLLSEKRDAAANTDLLSQLMNIVTRVTKGQQITKEQMDALHKNANRIGNSLQNAANKSNREYYQRARIMGATEDQARGMFDLEGVTIPPPPKTTDGTADSTGVMAPAEPIITSPHATKPAPKPAAKPVNTAPKPTKQWYNKVTGQPLKPGTAKSVIDSLKAKGIIEER